jgi:cellobiose transport system substrate-binding protein
VRQQLQRAFIGAIALATFGAMAGCGGDDSAGTGNAPSNEPIELTISTFGEFGYEDLLKEYETSHSNITIKHDKAGGGGPYHQALLTKMAGGSGVADVTAIERAHIPDYVGKAQLFNNLSEVGPQDANQDRWLPWVYEGGKANDGSLIGYGTDVGPLAVCYRKDLLAAAGMPSEPDAVKSLFATWDSFFQAGDTYVRATGKPFYDSNSQVFNAMVDQLPEGYTDKDGKLLIESNADIKKAWDQVTAAGARGQTAKLVAFSNEWNSGFKTGAFAVKTCPSWMLGIIKEQGGAELSGKWAIADAFPEDGGNWGGSYLTVPKQSKHAKEAAELAAWLTAPEQQIKAFKAKGNFPSQVKGLDSADLLGTTDPYFGGAKTGELFANRAKKVGKAQVKGEHSGQIQENATSTALQAVEQGTSAEEGWKQAVEAAKRIAR